MSLEKTVTKAKASELLGISLPTLNAWIKSEADNMHNEIYNFIQKLELNRNICLSTENQNSLIN